MSTRGAVGFQYKVNDELVIKATYVHSDAYLSGLGKEVCVFIEHLNSINGWEDFKSKVKKIVWVNLGDFAPDDLVERYDRFKNLDVDDRDAHNWYCLLREAQGADGLVAIKNGTLGHMIDNTKFLSDEDSCEYAYILDLDEMSLEVFSGCKPIVSIDFAAFDSMGAITKFIDEVEDFDNEDEKDDEVDQ
jgi:hypothetical protein